MSHLFGIMRGTGRTTRMIEEAISTASSGRSVYIIAANEKERCRIRGLIEKRGHSGYGIRVECSSHPNFDWERMTLRGTSPNCAVFVDHYAIETKYPLSHLLST